MGRKRSVVTTKLDSSRLSERWNEGVLLVEHLREKGIWAQMTSRIRVHRIGKGFSGIDAALFFIFFFGSKEKNGINSFCNSATRFRRELGAVGERLRLVTQSSMSRILSAVNSSMNRVLASWLLVEASGARKLLRQPSSSHYDTFGKAWHVFDWDGRSRALRQRALPEGTEFPAPIRNADDMASPGYTGRHRGETKFSAAFLQHAGSSLWIHAALEQHRADTSSMLPSALEALRSTCEYAELPLSSSVIRIDGAGGNVPCIGACNDAQIRYITRLSNYQLLAQEDVKARLVGADWEAVPDSKSGPMRGALDLGMVQLEAHEASPGGTHRTVQTRVIVSRFKSEKKSGDGVLLDGFQYELYGTDLSAHAWPAPEAVALYYERGSEENRFCQVDRETDLSHVFSYNPAGQELAVLMALFVWNLRAVLGLAIEQPPETPPALEPRVSAAVDWPAKEQAADGPSSDASSNAPQPASAEETSRETTDVQPKTASLVEEQPGQVEVDAAHETPTEIPVHSEIVPGPLGGSSEFSSLNDTREQPASAEETSRETTDVQPKTASLVEDQPGQVEVDAAHETPTEIPVHSEIVPGTVPLGGSSELSSLNDTRERVSKALGLVDWKSFLTRNEGWTRSPTDDLAIICPNGALVPLRGVDRPIDRAPRLTFAARAKDCASCLLREQCYDSARPTQTFAKKLGMAIPEDTAQKIDLSLEELRIQTQEAEARIAKVPRSETNRRRMENRVHASRVMAPPIAPDRSALQPRKKPFPVTFLDSATGPHKIIGPLLNPAVLRRSFDDVGAHIEVRIKVVLPDSVRKHRAIAASTSERQRCRKTWDERTAAYALPPGSDVHLKILQDEQIRWNINELLVA